MLGATAAGAAPALMPPLSQYGALPPAPLRMEGLKPDVRKRVEAAGRAAAEAARIAARAEKTIAAAKRAADKGRAAAAKTESLTISFEGADCRYAGETANQKPKGFGVMTCGAANYAGQFQGGLPDGLIAMENPEGGYQGEFRHGKRDGLGGDYAANNADAYEGQYKDGQRMGLGIERDRDGAYPGRYGFYVDPKNPARRVNMELLGQQDFRGTHWSGGYGSYMGPKIACTLIKGAVLEGSVLDGLGAKFDAEGKVTEQGFYDVGLLRGGNGPPC